MKYLIVRVLTNENKNVRCVFKSTYRAGLGGLLFSLFFLLSGFMFVGCSSLDVDSDRVVFDDQYNFSGANDTIYSMSAILARAQKLTNSYVLLGELRADLMDVSSTSPTYIKEINDFDISASNPYVNNVKDYYAIINNCNYVIHNIDTSIVKGGIKIMQKEYVAAKGIRAWTYMQLVLNYGEVIYYDKPILSVADAEAIQQQPAIKLNELAQLLIADLSPWRDAELPNFGTIYSLETRQCFFPIRFLLGDLYLWTGQYENAATEYYNLMYKGRKTISNYRTMFSVAGSPKKVFTHGITTWNGGWDETLGKTSSETMTFLGATNQYGRKFYLDSLCFTHAVAPSAVAINNWNSQIYVDTIGRDTVGDLRRIGSLSISPRYGSFYYDKPFDTNDYICKYVLLNSIDSTKNEDKRVVIYRNSLLYLRYAEAVNRLGKPNLAYAVLKYGLNPTTLANNKFVPAFEKTPLPAYMDFRDLRFTSNIGLKMRGCGNVNVDTTYYKIPNFALHPVLVNQPKQDSINFVEDAIQKELALETAFEGNRFHDLMRFAIRRNDPAYLADLVAAKHTTNKAAIRAKLMNIENWYLKK